MGTTIFIAQSKHPLKKVWAPKLQVFQHSLSMLMLKLLNPKLLNLRQWLIMATSAFRPSHTEVGIQRPLFRICCLFTCSSLLVNVTKCLLIYINYMTKHPALYKACRGCYSKTSVSNKHQNNQQYTSLSLPLSVKHLSLIPVIN